MFLKEKNVCSFVHSTPFVLQVPFTIVRYPIYYENLIEGGLKPEKQEDGSFLISKGLFPLKKDIETKIIRQSNCWQASFSRQDHIYILSLNLH